jgi:hypothetical protein
MSSYEVMDRILRALGDRSRFPNLRTIVVTGHSAGGQYTQRYAIGTQVDRELPGVELRYVVANPSSYMYFDGQRPVPFGGDFRVPPKQAEPCGENEYKYGLDKRNPYMARLDGAALASQYRARQVTYLLGTSDVNANDDGLDKRCGGVVQGRFRLERGMNYKAYMDRFFWPHAHRVVLVPMVAHEGDRIYLSTEGQTVLFR